MGGTHNGTLNGNSLLQMDSDYSSKDIGVAFALTIFAGLATVVGGSVVFFHRQKGFNPKLLSGGLSLAAGAIIYIAFADLLPEGTEFFVVDADSEHEEQLSTLWSTLCFFSGAALMALWSMAAHKLLPKNHSHELAAEKLPRDTAEKTSKPELEEQGDSPGFTSEDNEVDSSTQKHSPSISISEKEKTSLCHSGVSTAVALVMHSIPEGLVTFIATAQNPSVGAALAIGIAIHNVVEGMSIALPIYFATEYKWKAFGASALAGLAPLLGGLIGYAILETTDFSNIAFGIMFGLAAGMLIYIAIKELLRTAYSYDQEDQVVTICFFIGMALIAMALVILESTGNHNHAGGDSHGHSVGNVHSEVVDAFLPLDKNNKMNDGILDHHNHGDSSDNHHH